MSDFHPPWLMKPLDEWSIVGMNHYHAAGEKRIFVAMTKGNRCIVEEGLDDEYLWNRLWHKAQSPGLFHSVDNSLCLGCGHDVRVKSLDEQGRCAQLVGGDSSGNAKLCGHQCFETEAPGYGGTAPE